LDGASNEQKYSVEENKTHPQKIVNNIGDAERLPPDFSRDDNPPENVFFLAGTITQKMCFFSRDDNPEIIIQISVHYDLVPLL
jgi:hypothetical protein